MPAGGKPESQEKVVATNRRAWHDFEILERFEAGIALAGSEVKSLRLGHADLKEAYAEMAGGELWLCQLHINPYQTSSYAVPPLRRRKLLVRKAELNRLVGRVAHKGMTLVPLRLYFSPRGWAKIELGVAKGRSHADRRENLKKREAEREMRAVRGRG
ncbi:MAG: SsrA-binding protein SmpB [Candidatus Coatesbacteria bacterium]